MSNRLSDRQRQCLEGVAAHRTSKEIAAELGISPKTVDGYIAEAVALLGARNRQEAATLFRGNPPISAPGDFPGETPRVEPEPVFAPPLGRQPSGEVIVSRGLERLPPVQRLAIIALIAMALSVGLGLSAMAVVGGIAIYDPARSAMDRGRLSSAEIRGKSWQTQLLKSSTSGSRPQKPPPTQR